MANEFDFQRQQAEQQVAAGVQNQKDALKRRFAALGSVNSGAAIKQEQLAQQAGQENLERANQGINAQEQQVARQEREAQKQRDFALSEAQKQRDFAANERYLQDQKEEHQADLNRIFQREMAGKAQDIQKNQFTQQMDLAKQQFGEEQFVNRENVRIANEMLSQRDFIDRALNPQGVGDLPGGGYITWAKNRAGSGGGAAGQILRGIA